MEKNPRKENYPLLFFCCCAAVCLICVLLHEYPISIVSSSSPSSTSTNSTKFSDAPFPSPEKIELIRHSVLRICYEISDTKVVQSGCGHGFVYSRNGEHSYIALPEHCFPYDSTKQCKIWATDYEGRTIDLKWTRRLSYKNINYDAQILVVKKIFGLPSLCEMAVLTGYRASGDSAFIFAPFNVRNVEKKWGTFFGEEGVEMNTMISEFGDSGGLVLSRDGVAGVLASSSSNGSNMRYVPILVFEKIYGELMYNQN